MRQLLLVAVLFLSVQSLKSQTTWWEYNYVTNDLCNVWERGEVNNAYRLHPLYMDQRITWEGGKVWRKVDIYYLFKKATGKQKKDAKACIVLRCTDSYDNSFCVAIPVTGSDNEMWTRTYRKFSAVGQEWLLVYSWTLAKLMSEKLL